MLACKVIFISCFASVGLISVLIISYCHSVNPFYVAVAYYKEICIVNVIKFSVLQ